MLYNAPVQTVAAGGNLSFAVNQINSTGSIAASGSTGVTLSPGNYLVTLATDAGTSGSGNIGAALVLNGATLPYARSELATTGARVSRVTLTAVLDIVTAGTVTVINSTGNTNTYTNSTLTVVKLA